MMMKMRFPALPFSLAALLELALPPFAGTACSSGEEAPVTIRLGGGVVTRDAALWPLLGACPFRAFERGRVDALRLGGFGSAFAVRIGFAFHMAVRVSCCSDMAWCGWQCGGSRKSALPLAWSGRVRVTL
jgi:hypothetical protein